MPFIHRSILYIEELIKAEISFSVLYIHFKTKPCQGG
uniref:Uncharacterized protein n=1 Tax=Anguilla anguilla TaxID=7936 RepID=A0A0E9PY27_ANGAN